jgi:outer membrane protein assembly factor BamB
LDKWPSGGPPLAWKAKGLGGGFSSVSIAGGRIFTMGEGTDSSFVLALDVNGGKHLWTAKLGRPGGGGGYPGPRCTPTVDGNLLYALDQHGDLICLEASSGKEQWRKSLSRDFGGSAPNWGYTESPLVDGDKLLCTPGGSKGAIVALDKTSGAVLWRSKDFTDAAAYASIITAEIGGVRQGLQLTGASVAGVDLTDGRLLWRAPRRGQTAVITTPIFHDHHVYVTSSYGVGCDLFKVDARDQTFKAEQVYANKIMDNHHGGVVRVGEHLYGYSDRNGWVCQDFKTGKMIWNEKKLGKGSLAYADGHFYLRSEESLGTVALIEATPNGYQEKGRFNQPDRSSESSWPHPVIASGKLYLRDQDVLLCYDVKRK